MLLLHCFYLLFTLITSINSASFKRSLNEISSFEEGEYRDLCGPWPFGVLCIDTAIVRSYLPFLPQEVCETNSCEQSKKMFTFVHVAHRP